MPVAHIIGAGLSGLSSAVQLLDKGYDVSISEGAGEAGGRCRSFHDVALDCLIDNGNHLLLSGNASAMRFLDRVGARDELVGPPEARLNFVDLATNERWAFRPNRGVIPWWVFSADRRVAGTTVRDYLPGGGILRATAEQTVTDILPASGKLYERFWEPLVVGALNIDPSEAAAILLKPVLLETFAKGADACRPLIARTGLGLSFVEPALKVLGEAGAAISYGRRLKGLETENGRVTRLDFGKEVDEVVAGDVVVLAVPQWIASGILPEYSGPTGTEPIVNVHFRLPEPVRGMEDDPVLGVIGGMAQWLFVREDVVSVTISAARKERDLSNGEIIDQVWRDVAAALELGDAPLPKGRVVKEHRATFVQTPEQVKRRPGARTQFSNLFLAGDWTDTKLPATIEGSIRSGEIASACIDAV
ncbi:MAG: hydroxysqualene dehydroxylase HpnE [Pseudomonadota bacterium]